MAQQAKQNGTKDNGKIIEVGKVFPAMTTSHHPIREKAIRPF